MQGRNLAAKDRSGTSDPVSAPPARRHADITMQTAIVLGVVGVVGVVYI